MRLILFTEYTLKVNLMTSNKVINAEQKNKHKIMKDVHMQIAEKNKYAYSMMH